MRKKVFHIIQICIRETIAKFVIVISVYLNLLAEPQHNMGDVVSFILQK